MKFYHRVKKIKYLIIRATGIHGLFRLLFQRNNISVLLFHKPTGVSFNRTVLYLKKRYNIISLSDYVQNYQANTLNKLPKYSVILTFDDGHVSNYNLLKIIKEVQIKPTIFLCSGLVNTQRHFWFNHISKSYNAEEISQMSKDELLKSIDGFEITKEYEKADSLSCKEIMQMYPYVDFQVHGMFHYSLHKCTEIETYNEIVQSKIDLERQLGFSFNSYCFANGDYSDMALDLVKEAGYSSSLTVDYGYNNSKTDIYRIKRYSMNDADSIHEIAVRSTGLWAFIGSIRKKTYGYKKNKDEFFQT